MTLHINGEQRDFPDGLTVAGLVAQLGMKPDRVAVELNLEIVPRARWEATTLKECDKLEVVHFVGGGTSAEAVSEHSQDAAGAIGKNGRQCPTCGAAVEGKFCAACGEKEFDRHDLSMAHFFTHALGELLHFDSKIFRSLRLLFTRPGFLTSEYLRGCRKPYLHPFQLFFVANLIYFLLQPLTRWSGLKTWLFVQTHMMFYGGLASRLTAHRMSARGLTSIQINQAFDHAVDIQARSLVLLIVPLFAVVVWLVEWRKDRLFGEHMVFSLHFIAFWLITVLIVIYGSQSLIMRGLARLGVAVPRLNWDAMLAPVALIVLTTYLTSALRRVYHDSTAIALLKALALSLALSYVVDVYRFILFLTALYSS